MDKLLEIEQILCDIETDRIVELEHFYEKDILQDIILKKINEALKLTKELKESEEQ